MHLRGDRCRHSEVKQEATGATADGQRKKKCSGEAQDWYIGFSSNEASFTNKKPIGACVRVTSTSQGEPTDSHHWCRDNVAIATVVSSAVAYDLSGPRAAT